MSQSPNTKAPSLNWKSRPLRGQATPGDSDFSKDIAVIVRTISEIDRILQLSRDLSCFHADFADAAPEESRTITIDRKAMLGTMVFFTARLEDAIESLDEVKAMVSLLDKKSPD